MGSYEYFNAIEEFERLVANSTKSEIEEYDKIIQEQPEYSFFVSTPLNGDTKYKTGKKEKTNLESPFRKHSLAWMMALARVEIASTISMYGRVAAPFQMIEPADFGIEQYNLLLEQDAYAHLNALNTDSKLIERVKKAKRVDSDTIAYLRRLKVVRDMFEQVHEYRAEAAPPVVAEAIYEIDRARKDLTEQAELATMDVEIRYRAALETLSVQYSNVEARGPLERACQRRFLESNRRRSINQRRD